MAGQVVVSIIIPAYKSTWFEVALRSAIEQDYPHCEIIIGDDSPLNEIERIVDKLRTQSSFPIFYRRNTPAQGEMNNITTSLEQARGEFIKFLYDDDLLKPNCISALVEAINRHPDIIMATSRRDLIDAAGKHRPDFLATVPPVSQDSVLYGPDLARFQADQIINFVGEPSTVLIRTAVLHDLLATGEKLPALIGEDMPFLGDLALYTKVLRHGHLAYLCQSLSQFRISRTQVSQQARDDDSVACVTHRKYPEFVRQLGWYNDVLKPGHMRVAPLVAPTSFTEQDIASELNNGLTDSHFKEWFAQRCMLPVQDKLIEDWFSGHGKSTLCTLFIDVRTSDEASWRKTWQSLPIKVAGLSWQIIALVDVKADFIPVDIEQISINQSQGIAVLNERMAELQSDWILLVDSGCELLPSGIAALATGLSNATGCHAIFADEIYPLNGKFIGASFRPDFNLDLFLSYPAQMAHHWLLRREWLVQTGGFNPSYSVAFEFEALVRLIENQGFSSIGHLPEPLVANVHALTGNAEELQVLKAHLSRRGYTNGEVDATAHGPYRIKYQHAETPLVTIVVLARELINLIACITSLLEKTTYLNYELLIVADDTADSGRKNWLDNVKEIDPQRIKVVKFSGAWQRAAMINVAADNAQGDYLLFLHGDIAVINPDWLNNMLNHALRPEVGIVGAKQIHANNLIRHAGYILGINGVASEPFYGMDDKLTGHMSRLQADQNYSAVSGDFMLVRKEIFSAVGGFDTDLEHFDDIDFCLRVRQLGLLTVWTPYVRGLRQPAKNEAQDCALENNKALREQSEAVMFERWLPIISQDPAYNVNLTLSNINFNIGADSQLSWRPLSWHPLPVVMPHMADMAGCGYYRIIKPFEAMQKAGLVDGKLSANMLGLPELERYKPDSMIIQRRIGPEFHEWMHKISKFNKSFKVYELDDYLPNIPLKNHHRSQFGNDVLKMIRRSLSFMDRFVVSTEPLAEVFTNYHHDIVVMPNRLSEDWWGNLQSLRNQGKKPRVGWAGGSSHTGDLEMIADVIKEFANDVEWVFFGMCPAKLRPYVHEFHTGVDIEAYPAKLASLNLDLALAPVEDNLFNACKSNLRLLEYGACGIPVICSDMPCYRGSLPVTRVRNRFKDWRDAIRMHLNDPDASARMGQELRQVLRQDWMLNGDNLARWSKAWIPG
ncbi:O-antigen biosynthesis protein [Mixta theicola]|uniref:O-antigen biosynthesis protein n=1 Tax=Mixta theicola TaxID=1458355 RepID=A0A2K1Q5G6_9GAMM|nr:glycosyltransferase [Mixta theicola]PNS10217.1 O-antigen biosynthesis protein [Mixta theicola]GLR11024.1 O-antigen biosynthesis protein [Mixta theicola]